MSPLPKWEAEAAEEWIPTPQPIGRVAWGPSPHGQEGWPGHLMGWWRKVIAVEPGVFSEHPAAGGSLYPKEIRPWMELNK